MNWLFPPDPPPPMPHWPAPPAPTLPFRCSFAGECDFAPDMSGALDCFRRCLGRQPAITCGRGRHPATDPHTRGLAVDIGTVANPWLTTDEARRCFGSCFAGNSYAQQEYNSGNSGPIHYHIQYTPGVGGATGFSPIIHGNGH